MLRMSEERPSALKLDSGCGSVPCALCKCPVGVFTAPTVQPEGLRSLLFQKLHLSEDVAGATFMAAGSSTPELFASVIGKKSYQLETHDVGRTQVGCPDSCGHVFSTLSVFSSVKWETWRESELVVPWGVEWSRVLTGTGFLFEVMKMF